MDPSELGQRRLGRSRRRAARRVSPPQVLLTPRNEENPYLRLLKAAVEDIGVHTEWLRIEVTKSQTLNTLLLPFELARQRLRGFNLIHLHWSYNFAWHWSRKLPLVRRVPRWWFGFTLWFADTIGLAIVYTSHEPLPLAPVFDDDVAGRRPLFKRARAVVTITESAKRQLLELFKIEPARIEVIPEGDPLVVATIARGDARQRLGIDDGTPLAVMFGRLDPYKGVDALLEAVQQLPAEFKLALRLLGISANPSYATKLEDRVAKLRGIGRDVRWDRGAFSDNDLEVLLAAADLFVVPFKWITNSGSMRAAMARHVPVLVPDLPELADVPAEAVFRYDRTAPNGLREGIVQTLRTPQGEVARRVAEAHEWVNSWTWRDVAIATAAVYEHALQPSGRGRADVVHVRSDNKPSGRS